MDVSAGTSVDYQVLFNIAVAGFGALGAWTLGRITKTLDHLDADLREMPEKYVLKIDFSDMLQSIERKLDKIFDKLDGKADK